MKILGLILFFTAHAWAESQDLAYLKIITQNDTLLEQITELHSIEPQPDPLICRMVENKMLHLQRVDRQLSELRNQIAQHPEQTTQAELNEMANLELHRQQTYSFLSEEAPVMIATWPLSGLTSPQIKKLKSDAVSFELESYALLWQGSNDSLAMPEEDAQVVIDDWTGTLSLILKSNVSSFCSRKPTKLAMVL